MGIDPSIALKFQPVQAPDLMSQMMNAMSLKALAQKNQIASRELQDDSDKRAALKSHTIVDPTTGKVTFDRPGALSDLAKKNPIVAQGLGAELDKQQIDRIKAQADLKHAFIKRMQDPNEYDQARKEAIAAGLDGADRLPPAHPGDDVMKQMLLNSGDEKEMFNQHNKDIEHDLTKKKIEVAQNRNQTLQGIKATADQSRAFRNTSLALEGARGNPAIGQAEKDIQNADKANGLANIYGDPNKLSERQVNLLVDEIGKVAQGGSPSIHGLEGLTPDTLRGKMSRTWEKLTNEPTAANLGAFVKEYQDYANELKHQGQKVILDKYGRIIDTYKRQLHPDDAAALDKKYMHRFDQPQTADGKDQQKFDDDVIRYAQSHGISNQAAQKIKDQRTKQMVGGN
jgi:hypothetical protein